MTEVGMAVTVVALVGGEVASTESRNRSYHPSGTSVGTSHIRTGSLGGPSCESTCAWDFHNSASTCTSARCSVACMEAVAVSEEMAGRWVTAEGWGTMVVVDSHPCPGTGGIGNP